MYERYEKLLSERNVTNYRVSKDTGITQTTLSEWKKGKITPKTDTLQKIADYFNVSLDYLTGNTDYERWEDKYNMNGVLREDVLKYEAGVKIPVLGKVAAGIPIEAIQDIEEYEEIPEALARTGEFFALRIKGESMEPKFSDGDVVIVKKQDDVVSGEIGVVIVNGQDATVKKIVKQENGLLLIATNQAVFPPKFYDIAEMKSSPVRILGKVVELRAKF